MKRSSFKVIVIMMSLTISAVVFADTWSPNKYVNSENSRTDDTRFDLVPQKSAYQQASARDTSRGQNCNFEIRGDETNLPELISSGLKGLIGLFTVSR